MTSGGELMSLGASDFGISVDTGELRFSAAHFITYQETCENLHGHNFHVRIDARGDNSSDELLIDFVLITRLAAGICQRLHDKVLLPANSREVTLADTDDGCIEARSYDKRFVLPRDNCFLLPVGNTTAEMLAWYIGEELLKELHAHNSAGNVSSLTIAVEEADRQWGVYRRDVRSAV
jgi:6-pyruvoyltetrahydropterin/6-carboxytetrahydropterin synthase